MTLLSKIFKKAPETKPVANKKEQVATESESIKQLDQMSDDEIVNIAACEQKHLLRVAAIKKLPYAETLKNLAFNCSSSKTQLAARERLATLIDNQELEFEQLNTDVADKVALLAIASFSNQVQLQEQVLSGADDDEFLHKVVLEGASTKLRQIAAHRITDRKILESLQKKIRGKDKTIYRIVKEKCDVFKEQDKQRQQLTDKINSLCMAMERLSKRAFDPMFNANFNHMNEQWLSIKKQNSVNNIEIPNELSQRIDQALSVCLAVIDEQIRIQTENEQRREAVARAVAVRETILGELRQLIKSLYEIDSDLVDKEQEIASTLLQQQQSWEQSVQYVPVSKEQLTGFEQFNDAIVFLQRQLAQNGTLKQQLESMIITADSSEKSAIKVLRERLNAAKFLNEDKLPEQVIIAQKLIASWDKKQHQDKNAAHQLVRQVGGLIHRAVESIEKGQVRQAAGIRRSIEQKTAELKKMPAALSEQLERLDEKLDQLQDWRSYAVQPKMEELVEKMQALVDETMNPDVLADKIKHLQEQWKMLSVGGGSQYQELWEKFHQLAQTAYEPCKVYFKKQADIRQENLQKRKNLVAQLEDFCSHNNWEAADWKLVEKTVKAARQEWREYSPTDRSASKEIQEKFDKHLEIIHQYLDVEYKKNIQYKQQIINQAKGLVDSDDLRFSVEEVKKLQAKWKTIGVVSRKSDQALWKEFRAHCDSVFDKRQQQTAQFKAQLNNNKEQAESICAELDNLSTLTGKALFDARNELERLQSAFYELGAIPKNSTDAIKIKFLKAIEKFEEKIIQERKHTKEKIWINLLDASAAVATYDLAIHNGESDIDAKNNAQNVIDSIEQWPKGGKEAIAKKMAEVTIDRDIDFEANETALRRLCIRMEILSDTQTPQSDQTMRMAYQVERLQHGLGQNLRSNEPGLVDMIFEWISIAPVPPEIYDELLQRFNHCRKLLV